MPPENPPKAQDRELDRQGRRFGHSAAWFLIVTAVLAVPGIILILIGRGWSVGVGIAVLLIACGPGAIGFGLLGSSVVSRWAARRKLFA